MKVRIHVSLKPGVLDPQGLAVHHALEGLGFEGVQDVRIGRLIELDVADDTTDATLDEMCRKLLANMVIENYRIEKPELVSCAFVRPSSPFPAPTATATWRWRWSRFPALPRTASGMATPNCRTGLTSSACLAAFHTAITCVQARWQPAARSCKRSSRLPAAGFPCSASATASRF